TARGPAVDGYAFGSAPQPQSVLGLIGEFGSDRSLRGDKDDAMRVGISLTSNHPDVKDPRQGARWMIERAAAAHRSELDSLFVGDQHVSPTPYYQNTPMLGRLLAEWGEAPAGCLFLLPLWHPVLVAEQIGTLAAVAQGRFIMQCGLGWGEDRFAAMGANFRTRPSAFEEALDIIRRLLAGETVSSSRRFRVAEASLALRPAEPVGVWAGGSADRGIGRRGHRTISRLREGRLRRDPGAASDQRSAEGFGLAGTAGSRTRCAGPSLTARSRLAGARSTAAK